MATIELTDALKDMALLETKTIKTTEDPGIMYNDTMWEDLRFPFTQTKRGASDLPHFDYDNIGLLFPNNDATEKIYIIAQFPHAYKLGSDAYPHVHWRQANATVPTWKMTYAWFNLGDTIPAFSDPISVNTGVFDYPGGSISQLSSFAPISGAGIDMVSSIMLITFYREDNTGIGDVLAYEFDIHYQIDQPGSKTELVK
jgi:hypothetical protein